MRQSLFSPLWYRVAAQQPYLRREVRVSRQRYRGEIWFVLVNETTHRHYRVTERAFQVIGRCDGVSSVQQIWDTLLGELQDDAPTQDEVIGILSQLDQQGLLGYEGLADVATLLKFRDERVQRKRRGLLNPFAFQVELGNPSPVLRRLDRVGRALFRTSMLWVWCAAVLLALAAAALNWSAIAAHATAHLHTPYYLMLAWAAFPFIKALHELGHGLAVRRWGGEVHSAGLTLFLLTPAPYMDASAAAAFRAPYQRAMVSAVGIMVELAIAAGALLVWLNVQPGVLRDVAFVTMVTASLSTLLFNGNPLLRFDGYYLLCDAVDLPNLATRSRAFWLERLSRLAFGVKGSATIEPAPGERGWLIAYAPLSTAYRLFACALIVLWAGGYSLVLGTAAAAYVLVVFVAKPLVAAARVLISEAPGNAGLRGRTIAGVTTAAFVLLIAVVPFPFHTAAHGVVWPPDEAHVRPGVAGFVSEIPVRDGERVAAGEVLLRLEDPVLHATRAELTAELERIRTGVAGAMRDPGRTADFERETVRIEGELQRTEEKIAQLELRAQIGGTLVMPRQQDLPGSFVKQGAPLGYVLNAADTRVRAAVPERDAALVRERVQGVAVRLAEDATRTLEAELVADVPASTRELPSAALSERGGGPFVADPSDRNGLKITEPVVLVDVRVPGRELDRIGGRAWLRFEHGAEPLVAQWYRRARQLLLGHFNPSA